MRDEERPPLVEKVRIGRVTDTDVEGVIELASKVWWHHYPGIISPAQIEYMLRQRYEPALIREELQRHDLWWDKLVADVAIIAFASSILAEPATVKLDKLYVHPAYQRKGYGALLVDHVCQRARERNCLKVILAVNKRNAGAIAAYARYGFRIEESAVTDIGDGFVMDDYIMARQP
jgi:GNAT superfamily N-acetyltransferase